MGENVNIELKNNGKIEKKKVNKLCNVAFWFGIVSVFLFEIGIIPLIGIVLSIAALIKLNKETQKGLKRAITGLVLNVLYLLCNAHLHGHI